jgi:hypothetical protein
MTAKDQEKRKAMTDDMIPVRPEFRDLVQIGVVISDLDASIRVLSEVFGIGPFRTIDWPPAGRTDMERFYHGGPADFTARMAWTELGPIELELIEPLEGESIWSDFLEEHGEGIHHIRFNVSDLEGVIRYLTAQGIAVTQQGSGIRPGTTWAYLGTESKVGFIVEVMNVLPGTDGRTPEIVDGTVQA